MLDLKKLNDMLDSALESETTESLNRWIDEQIKADQAQGIIRDAEFGTLNTYNKYSEILTSEKTAIEIGMSEYISYNQGIVSDAFDSSVLDEFNFAA